MRESIVSVIEIIKITGITTDVLINYTSLLNSIDEFL